MAAIIVLRHVQSGTVEVTNTAKKLSELEEDGSGSNYAVAGHGIRCHMQNLDEAATIFVAPTSSVVASDAAHQGWRLGPSDVLSLDWPKGDIDGLYFISTTTGVRMRIWEESFV